MSKGISPQVRTAEGYYVAVQLKNAMQQSGFWGAVRVVPKDMTGGDVIVFGRLLQSDGEIIKLEVNAEDVTGNRWLAREYEEVVPADAYSTKANSEVFQFLYNRIANDLAAIRTKMSAQTVESIRQVSELKFAGELAPDIFGSYLKKEDQKKDSGSPVSALTSLFRGQSSSSTPASSAGIVRLPAKDDPMLARIKILRTREESFIETIDLQHQNLVGQIGPAYTKWRIARLKEVNAVRKVEAKAADEKSKATQRVVTATIVGALVGAIAGKACGNNYGCMSGVSSGVGAGVGVVVSEAMRSSMKAEEQAQAETEVNKVALQELGESLGRDLQVTVVKTEGETIELRGSAGEKFKTWRDMLKRLHESESGLMGTSAPARN